MSRAKPRNKKNPGKQGQRLTPVEKEHVLQTYMLFKNKKKTAEMCGVSIRTVYNILDEAAQAPKELQEDRLKVARRIGSKISEKLEQTIDSLTPEELESGRIPIRDPKSGEVVAYKHYGPTAPQKALVIGILQDKMKVNEEYQRAIGEDADKHKILLPTHLGDLRDAILGEMDSLSFLKIDFKKHAPDVERQTQELLEDLEVARVEEPEIVVDDFDNPA